MKPYSPLWIVSGIVLILLLGCWVYTRRKSRDSEVSARKLVMFAMLISAAGLQLSIWAGLVGLVLTLYSLLYYMSWPHPRKKNRKKFYNRQLYRMDFNLYQKNRYRGKR